MHISSHSGMLIVGSLLIISHYKEGNGFQVLIVMFKFFTWEKPLGQICFHTQSKSVEKKDTDDTSDSNVHQAAIFSCLLETGAEQISVHARIKPLWKGGGTHAYSPPVHAGTESHQKCPQFIMPSPSCPFSWKLSFGSKTTPPCSKLPLTKVDSEEPGNECG